MAVKWLIMRVSGKITHSFYCFLRTRGFDVSRLYELTSLEMEFLKDPSQWMDLNQVESLLKKLNHEYSSHFVDQDFLVIVGHSCFELRAWGELDSVLKMKKSKSMFSNLPVFLSYFISNDFSFVNERDEKGFLGFKCNLSSEEYPFVTEYLRAVLEALPVYANKPRAEAKWIRNYVQIKWEMENPQVSLFPGPSSINIKPELLSDLKRFLEKVEKELYYQRQQIQEKNKQIRNLKDQLLMQRVALPEESSFLIQQMEQSLLELKSISFSKEQSESVPGQPDISHGVDSLLYSLEQLKKSLNIKF